jgi:hypothetical protein
MPSMALDETDLEMLMSRSEYTRRLVVPPAL